MLCGPAANAMECVLVPEQKKMSVKGKRRGGQEGTDQKVRSRKHHPRTR